jgi:MFS family permease
MVVGGFVFPMAVAAVMHLVSGTVLLAISGLAWIACPLMFAIMPEGASYWAFAFPAMIGATLGIDVTYNVTTIFITSNMPAQRQGLAGAMISSTVHLSIAFLLGFADLAQVMTADLGRLESYRVVFWYQVACATVSFLIVVFLVRVDAAKSEMTVDERQRMETEGAPARYEAGKA